MQIKTHSPPQSPDDTQQQLSHEPVVESGIFLTGVGRLRNIYIPRRPAVTEDSDSPTTRQVTDSAVAGPLPSRPIHGLNAKIHSVFTSQQNTSLLFDSIL